jgi:tripartite-type tricarboxylate transporter receptor subunit TctC
MPTLLRRSLLLAAAATAAAPTLATLATIAGADTYPSRPVRMIIGFPPGGATDIAARLIGQWLSDHLGQPFIVESRPGAVGNIATEAVVRAVPDGYTLLVAVGANTINPALYDLNFNFIRDMAMVAGILRTPLVLEVNPDLPVHSVPELIAYAKANPGKLTIGSFGTGSISHIAGELFKMTTGTEMVHVPYRGSAPLVVDLLGGQVQVAFDNLPPSIGHIRAGKLRPLAVTTTTRSPALPDIPMVADFLPGFEASAWAALAVPKAVPRDIVGTLSKQVAAALDDPTVVARLAELGATPFVGSPAELDKLVALQTEKWGKVIRAANIKPE